MFDKDFIGLMLLHCDRILRYINGVTYENWLNDEILQDAVCKRLDSLTECVKEYHKRHREICSEFPNIPWNKIIAFRNRDVHHYESTDFDMVWNILECNIPPLYKVIKEIATRGNSR